jgi:hypothetical protein
MFDPLKIGVKPAGISPTSALSALANDTSTSGATNLRIGQILRGSAYHTPNQS